MVSPTAILLVAVTTIYPCFAFHSVGRPPNPSTNAASLLRASDDAAVQHSAESSLDPSIAAQFTIQVCTSTSCTRKLKDAGLDQYQALGEIYAQAQSANLEKSMIIEDSGCMGGRNCKMGPCVAVMHEDFEGNVALEGMNSNEFQESVFHNVLTNDDAARVWSCMENAISLMADEANANNEGGGE
mmetsp:Transcript_14798/g.32147  ORF Transcript_14798/g.32147 Transcript_14798/m.32147 type:complete len:185 (+) Transcript_14798:126-680(+)|eukprot:CAMPEP_0172314394 /NCGR_PEP_ID=MMETSP1058-20130122/22421_1 /TAXON_ID=83371 /ORGANISM="Detonula confervacea, Strain CCMP 353" /LENGTH=184 /DNA_ID=CAMNT_0013028251 /DNA_START=49 /DNA_END=603 /DNA_ORIENTATION=-